MGRKKKSIALDLRPDHAFMRPGNQVFIDRMQILAHDIWMESTGPDANWHLIELKASELATMCQMRRIR